MAQQGNDGGNNPMLPFGYNPDFLGHSSSSSDQQRQQQQSGFQQQSILDPSDASFMQQFFQNPDAASAGEEVYSLGSLSVENKPDNGGFGPGWDFGQQFSPPPIPNTSQPQAAYSQQGLPVLAQHHPLQQQQPQQHHQQPQQGMGGIFGDPHEQMTQTASDADLLSGASSLFNLSSQQEQQQQQQQQQQQHQQQAHQQQVQQGPFAGGQWGNIGVVPMIQPPENLQSPLPSSGRQSSGGSLYTPVSSQNPTYNQQQIAQQVWAMAQMQQTHQQQQQHQHSAQPQQSQSPLPQGQPQGPPHARHLSLTTSFQPVIQHAMSPQQWQQSPFQQHQQQGGATRPVLFRYGTDTQFAGPHGYRAPMNLPPDLDKSTNLMNVPLAAQIAASRSPITQQMQGFRPSQPQILHRHSVQGPLPPRPSSAGAGPSPSSAVSRYPMSSPVPGASVRPTSSWTAVQVPVQASAIDEGYSPARSLKRPRSEVEPEEQEIAPQPLRGNIPKRGPKVPKVEQAVEDVPYEAQQTTPRTPKRRKSTVTSRPSADSIPSDIDSPARSASGQPESSAQASSSKRKSRESKPRQILTEEQKRANHIQSEQKRRNIIKQGYDDLNVLVPSLAGGKSGFSKSEILKEVIAFLEAVINGNRAIEDFLANAPGGGGK